MAKADKRTVFAGDLNNPTGFEFYNGGVLVAQAPNLVFLKDTNGDDKYDVKEMLLSGFDTADTHHTINSFTFDPGGALYMQEGIFHRTQIESPWGPTLRQADGGVYPIRAEDLEDRNLHADELPESARPRVRRLGPRHRVRRDRRPAVLRTVVLDQEVLPGDGDATRRRARAPCGRVPSAAPRFSRAATSRTTMQGNVIVLNTIGFRGLLNYKLTEDGAGLKSTEVEPILSVGRRELPAG